MTIPQPRIVAAIPAYNEEKTIAKVVIEAQRYVDAVIVCDDGSKDMTKEIAEKLGAEVIRHSRNKGKGSVMKRLFMRAREMNADVIVTLDADGQHDANEIPRLLEPILDGSSDIVVGSRFMRDEGTREMPKYRKIGTKIISRLAQQVQSSTGSVQDIQSGFRAYGKEAIDTLTPSEQGMGVDTELLMKGIEAGFRIAEIPITISYNGIRNSKHKAIFHGLDVVASTIKFTSLRHPLAFYGVPALAFLVIGVGFGLWSFQIYLSQGILITNIALIAISSTLAGLVLGTTGIILFSLINILRERY